MTTTDLRRRLQRMAMLSSAPKYSHLKAESFQNLSTIPGLEIETSSGPYYVVKTRYPLGEVHGEWALGDLLRCSSLTASRLAHTNRSGNLDLSGLAFLDTETTGLAGGAGTLAFLVGVGRFVVDEFILHQFFLGDPEDELAMLAGLSNLLGGCSGVATFNGYTFDIPLLETRFMLNRHPSPLRDLEHIDLLPLSRRMWRGRTTRCSLGVLEQEVLGITRSGDDVPGWLIPRIYANYLRTGDAHEIRRIIYHNSIDILSMVTLSTHLLQIFTDPLSERHSGLDCLRIALWLETNGTPSQAESAYRAALDRPLPQVQHPVALRRLAAFLKRANRRDEALTFWEQLADMIQDDPDPCVEIAKYFEWHVYSMHSALSWTERALRGVKIWPRGWRRDRQLDALQHRLDRLQRKIDNKIIT